MHTLILGGARSGKSRLAQSIASDSGKEVCLIVTARAGDDEMRARIERHRAERPGEWSVVEEPLALAGAIAANAAGERCLIVDCLTLWLSNLLLDGDPNRLVTERDALLHGLRDTPGQVLLVSNETGLGIVPDNALARRFRDEAGLLHQALAARCHRVALTVAGLPMWLKSEDSP